MTDVQVLDRAYQIVLPGQGLVLAASLPPAAEWLSRGNGEDLLQQLADGTNGTVLSLDVPADPDLFTVPGGTDGGPGVATPVWMYPLFAALALLVVEIGLRQARLWAQDSAATAPMP